VGSPVHVAKQHDRRIAAASLAAANPISPSSSHTFSAAVKQGFDERSISFALDYELDKVDVQVQSSPVQSSPVRTKRYQVAT
jgi:hypothetical protein